jgi:hypothetical protein
VSLHYTLHVTLLIGASVQTEASHTLYFESLGASN